MTERKRLLKQLLEGQENSHSLGCQMEEMKAEIQQLKLSERSLLEEAERLREENHNLQRFLREAINQTPSQSSQSLGTSSPSCSTIGPGSSNTAMAHSFVRGLGEAVAATIQKKIEDYSSPAKPDPVNLSMTTETIDEFNLGNWCSRGLLNLEETPSEESDALREAYRSMALQGDVEPLQEDSDSLEAALQHTQQQLQVASEENAWLKLQLIKQTEEAEEKEQSTSGEKCDLLQALNEENRALADRIEELLAHIKVREEEVKNELKEHISKLEEDRAKLKQENQEQSCLITELTMKTEDDLNTIMNLQQQLEESRKEYSLHKCSQSFGDSVLNREKPQLISCEQIVDLTLASVPDSLHNNSEDFLQNRPDKTLHVSSLSDQVDHLTMSVHILKTEQDELQGQIKCLREQQKEVAQSVQTQTEEKHHLTRAVWGLKEEKDNISKYLAGLKEERDKLSRTVSGLKNSKDNLIRSMSGLKEEKETLSRLEQEKQSLMEFLSSRKEEQDQILKSLQCLQREKDQLVQEVPNLKQEREGLTNSLKCLQEEREQNQLSYTLQEDTFIKSMNILREEKEQAEHSVSCLKQEEKQLRLEIQRLRVEKNCVQTFISQTQSEETKQKQHLLGPNGADRILGAAEGYDAEQCHTNIVEGNCTQEPSDLMREVEALGGQLKRSRKELEEAQAEVKTLHSELCQSEARRGEAEVKAIQAAEQVIRVMDLANQVEEGRKENENLTCQVRELQSKLTGAIREKTDVQSLKTQIEEQYNILSAQLRAKSTALEELNSEYITLKQGQGSKKDMSTVLTSLWTRYNNIRAKYDALLKKKSQTDLDIAPLKAKLSCLVVKCQERNSLLVQMMKAMQRQGCMDSTLTQQVEQLLSDSVLQDYAAAFTTGGGVRTQIYSAGFAPGCILNLPLNSSEFLTEPRCPAVNKGHLNALGESGGECRDIKTAKHTTYTCSPRESTENHVDCSDEVTAILPGTSSPVQARLNMHDLPPSAASSEDALNTHSKQDLKEKFSAGLTSLTGPCSPLFSPRGSLSRRLSSPEKIINLHQQLQKTLMNSYEAPVSRGRKQQPRKSLLFSSPADPTLGSQTKAQLLCYNNPHTNSDQVTTGHNTNIPIIKPTAINKSVTLFNAVASRSADVTLSPNVFIDNHTKAVVSRTTAFAASSASDIPVATTQTNKAKSILKSCTHVSTTPTKEMTVSDKPNAACPASTRLTLPATGFDSALSICSDTNPKNTASDTTASIMLAPLKGNTSNMTSKEEGAAQSNDDFVFASTSTSTTHTSPGNSRTSARGSPAGLEKTKRPRPKPEAPAEVSAVEVIRTVGQSSLMIGWERPPLDELGCSNGTFVYGYRVFVDGDFHKSVMSSACTKCILENVDLSVPIHISIQTLGSNGLSSNSVHITYRAEKI